MPIGFEIVFNNFNNSVQELTYNKVADYLATSALFAATVEVIPDQPKFHIPYGSARVDVEVLSWDVHPWEKRELAIVRACSCVTVNSLINADLMSYLLRENTRMRFGSFQLGPHQEILFAHSVLGGENLDLMELQTCILSVVAITDTYDDLLIEKFGGRRGGN
jgi:hypothetical protein